MHGTYVGSACFLQSLGRLPALVNARLLQPKEISSSSSERKGESKSTVMIVRD